MFRDLKAFVTFGYCLLAGWASVHFAHAYMVTVGEHGPATFEKLTDFTASKPFQNRVLPCLLAKVLDAPLSSAKDAFPGLPLGTGLDLAYMGLIGLSVFGLLFVFKELLLHFGVGWMAFPLSFTILYPTWVNHYWLNILRYPSDVPSLFFFALGLLLLLRRKWIGYYVVFVLATINRETSCFLTVAMLCLFLTKDNLREMFYHWAAQFLIWMSLKAGLSLVFINNPGSVIEWHNMFSNFKLFRDLCNGESYDWYIKLGGNANWIFFTMGGLWALVPFLWSRLPLELRRLFWVMPPYALGYFLVTFLWEVRAWNEVVVLITLFVTVGLSKKFISLNQIS
ncbi:MAG: hypothetical protein CMI31_06310 [Opitutae bacterium]|nr:hypothetical protein [Opitutae bacterium]|tara:strand:- start:3681 stop:4694 length:1014 start_codon:yes stop_codon:yes gene_type:complete